MLWVSLPEYSQYSPYYWLSARENTLEYWQYVLLSRHPWTIAIRIQVNHYHWPDWPALFTRGRSVTRLFGHGSSSPIVIGAVQVKYVSSLFVQRMFESNTLFGCHSTRRTYFQARIRSPLAQFVQISSHVSVAARLYRSYLFPTMYSLVVLRVGQIFRPHPNSCTSTRKVYSTRSIFLPTDSLNAGLTFDF